MLQFSRAVPAIFLTIFLLPVSHLAAQSPEADRAAERTNVLLTVHLGKLVDGKRSEVKSYRLVLVDGGSSSRLLAGARVPFPAAADDAAGPGAFVYQNVGFTTEAHAWVLADGRVKIIASIEDSRVVAGNSGAPPSVQTRQLSVNAVLKPGIPMEVTRVEGIQDQSGFVEIEAEVGR